MMSRNRIPSAVFPLLLFACMSHAPVVASVVYEIDSRSGPNGEWSLDGGSITTDGTIGDITPANFIEWSIQFSSPLGQYQISSDNGAALLITTSFVSMNSPPGMNSPPWVTGPIVRPSLIASSEQIYASFGNVFGTLEIFFASEDIMSSTFSGQAVVFFPSQFGSFLIGGGSSFGLIDNNIDVANQFRPFGQLDPSVLPQAPTLYRNSNMSRVVGSNESTVLASARSVPEPVGPFLLSCLLIPVLSRRRKSEAGLMHHRGTLRKGHA